MKAALLRLVPILFLASSCTTGFYLAGGYDDDIYYDPSDHPVVVQKQVEKVQPEVAPVHDRGVVDTLRQEENNQREYVLVDSLSEEYVDENGNTVINNSYFYEPDDEMEYTNRINRFDRPFSGLGYFDTWGYDPYYSWYSPGWSMGFYSPWYSSWYSPGWSMGFYSPWYSSWYSPGWSMGYYSPWYNSWYSPWYNPYYSWYYNDYGYSWSGMNNFRNRDNYFYGHRNSRITDGAYGGASSGGGMGNSGTLYSTRGSVAGSSSSAGQVKSGKEIIQRRQVAAASEGQSVKPKRQSDLQNPRSSGSTNLPTRSSRTTVRPPVSRSYSPPKYITRVSPRSSSSSRSTYIRPRTSTSQRSGSIQRSVRRSSGSQSIRSTSRSINTGTIRRSSTSSGRTYRSTAPVRYSGSSGRSSGWSTGSSGYRSSSSGFRSSSSVSRSSGSVSHSSGGSRSSGGGSRSGGRR